MNTSSHPALRNTILIFVAAITLCAAGIAIYAARILFTIPEIFELNEQRKVEGYYMAEFEFKMLGCAYYLDKGEYFVALDRLNAIHQQLQTTEGLVKVPEFSSKDEELDFYLEMQNPRTGAFMDDSYPLFTFIGSTENVIEHIDYLCQETGRPLQLKYPLRFLDDINSPEELAAFLDDVAEEGWIGARFRSTYVAVTELNSYREEMAHYGLYDLSPEWEQALLQWFYNNQDPQTGFWGPRSRYTGQLIDNGDLVSTEKVIKMFRDSEGRDLYPGTMPLRHIPQIISSTLERITAPMPDELELQHDWTLVVNRGTRIMVRYLWPDTSPEDRARFRESMRDTVISKYEQNYVSSEGAFSLYSSAEHADLDGTGEVFGFLELVGYFSADRQIKLWNNPAPETIERQMPADAKLTEADFAWTGEVSGINSIRLYNGDPGVDYIDNVLWVAYPTSTPVLDRMELLPALQHWTVSTQQSMGNWVDQDSLADKLSHLTIENVLVKRDGLPLEAANEALEQQGSLTVIGFDMLQVPVYRVDYKHIPG